MTGSELYVNFLLSVTHLLNTYMMQFQTGLDIMSRLPPNTHIGAQMSDGAVGLLYNSLAHPPTAYFGNNANHRHADGGFNNSTSRGFHIVLFLN